MNVDSCEYDILEEAVRSTKHINGLTCEIGVREGGSTKIILDILKETNQNKVHIAIDPFGNIEYNFKNDQVVKFDYTNKMKNRMLSNLYSYCNEHNMECLFFPLEDVEFFEKYKHGVPIYNETKQIINIYSMVFLDGPHSLNSVKTEFDFFKFRISKGGFIVFDDIDKYPHMNILDEYIISNGFKMVAKGTYKISYIKLE
jgi:cephalosporin hydroxylase